jgi:branched-chain amino acid transport system permease protein
MAASDSSLPNKTWPFWTAIVPLRIVGGAAVLAVLWALQGLFEQRLNDYVLQIVILAGINIILAVSLNLINGITGQFSLGHAGFMAIGAYVGGYVSVLGSARLDLPQPVIFALALLAAAAFSGLAGYVVGLPSLRLRGDYLAIVTLGFGEIIRVLWTTVNRIQLPAPFDGLNEVLGSVELGAARGFTDIPLWTNFVWTFALALLCILTVRNLADSSLGRSMMAVREDEIAAEAAGVNTTQIKVLAFVVSSMWAGVAGALGVHLIQYANPNAFNFMRSVEIVVMVVLGGLGSITGAALTAVLLKILEEVLRSVNGAFVTGLLLIALTIFWSVPRHKAMLHRNPTRGFFDWLGAPGLAAVLWLYLYIGQREWLEANVSPLRFVIYGLILVVLMLLRPQGLLGRSELGWHLLRKRQNPAQNET